MSWFKNLKVRAKMILAFTLVVLIMAALAAFAIIQLSTVSHGYEYAINHPIEAEIQMHMFDKELDSLRRLVTTMALFAYYDDPARINGYHAEATESYRNGIEALDAYEYAVTSGKLSEEAKNNTLKQISDIKGTFEKYKVEVCDKVADEARAGNPEGAMNYVSDGVAYANSLYDSCMSLIKVATNSAITNVASAVAAADQTVWILIAVAVVAAIISIIIALYISGLISPPLIALAGFMKKAGSTGDIKLQPDDMARIEKYGKLKDEIGLTISNTATFISHVTTIADELETISGGDLTLRVEQLSEVDVMGKSLNHMVNTLNSMFAEIQASTNQVSTGSKQIADGAQSLAQGSTEQAASVQELSSSIAEIAQKTKTNAETADKTAKLAEDIIGNAEKGSNQMDEMMSAVQEINTASQNIINVIKVIDDIAFQTNILALNAAVEAARAGQHGKGFAVVAEEVRNLASKSAEAAKETSSMIENSMSKAELGVRIAGETAASLSKIVIGINESNEFIKEIAVASEEQSEGIRQINIGIDQVAQVVQQNSATAEEEAAASQEMSGQSDVLQELISQFKIKGGTQPGYSSSFDNSQKYLAMPETAGDYSPGGHSASGFGKY